MTMNRRCPFFRGGLSKSCWSLLPASGPSSTVLARPDSAFCSATATSLPRNPCNLSAQCPTPGREIASPHCAGRGWRRTGHPPAPSMPALAIPQDCRPRLPHSVAARDHNLLGGCLYIENAIAHVGADLASQVV